MEDLTAAIELYNTLIGLGRYDDAYVVFRDRLDDATLYRLSASRLRVELLEVLFPDGPSQPPRLVDKGSQADTLPFPSAGPPLPVERLRRPFPSIDGTSIFASALATSRA